MDTDNQLLAEYCHHGSEAAFRELVERHIKLVHAAALRESRGNVTLAEDITQAVFTELARRAPRLVSHPAIAGWLYTCVRRMTANVRRAEDRRQRREQEAFNMNQLLTPDPADQLWQQVRPVLDDVMHELDEENRTAVVLRFFEGRTLSEVGAALGLTEDAARMRVERSLEKLHTLLSRRGVNSTTATLAAVLAAGAAVSVPSTLASSVATGAIATAAVGGSAIFSVAKLLALAQTKTAAAGALAALAAAAFILFHQLRPNPDETSLSEPAAPAAASSLANDSTPNELDVPAAAPTNLVAASRMALQLLEAETGAPLPGAKLHRYYWREDGPDKVVKSVTDANGQARVDMPPQASYGGLNLFVTADGHVPKVTSWGRTRPMPPEYTMKLERGLTIGGIVVDVAGQPIAGAQIQFDSGGNDTSVPENIQFGPDTPVTTDANGQWSCNMIPKEREQISLLVIHPEHAETKVTVRPDAPDANQLVITMQAGFSIAGFVQDSNGDPITGAEVRQVRLNRENERSKKTDASGAFELKNMALGELMLAVLAQGFAPAAQTLQLTGNVATLQFQLGPGQILRGRVTDEEGNPLASAFVETTRRDIDKARWSTNTDAEGRFEWDSAPQEPLLYSVLADGFSRVYALSLRADGSEHEIKLTRHQPEKEIIQITGTAVDADTGLPLDTFNVLVSEVDLELLSRPEFHTEGKQGQFTLSLPSKSNFPGYQVRIEKEEYVSAVSAQLMKKDGNQKLEFKLQKGAGPSGVVLLTNGEPAVNAAVFLCTPRAGVTIDGPVHVERSMDTTTCRAQTDSAGKFSLPPVTDPQGLIIIHDQGYAEVSLGELATGRNLILQPWGRVEGKLMRDSRPAANEQVRIWNEVSRYSENGQRFGFLTLGLEATTDADGKFAFDKVPPGKCKVRVKQRVSEFRQFPVWETPVTVKAGELTKVLLGGTGRPITGRAVLPGATGSILWRKVPVELRSKTGNESSRWPRRKDFPSTQAYVAAAERFTQAAQAQQRFVTVCDSDGSFCLADVPAGKYELEIWVRASQLDSLTPRSEPAPVLGSLIREVVVPDDKTDEPFDLGTVELIPPQNNASAQ